MSNLYKQYLKEEENREVIETEEGFITYSIIGEECYVAEVYVVPAQRNKLNSHKLLALVVEEAKKSNCKFLTANTFMEEDVVKYTRKVRLMIDAGFLINKVMDRNIIFYKKI